MKPCSSVNSELRSDCDTCKYKKYDERPERTFVMPMVNVLLQPEEKHMELPRHKVKSVLQLLKMLHIRPGTALVARGDELLTPDRELLAGDALLVRKVTSSG